MLGTLKKYIDRQIGDHGYISVIRHDNAFLCEGRVGELRSVPLWELIDEESAIVHCAYSGTSESGRPCIVIKLEDDNDDRPPWE
ncbi:MAG: hypothetical protein LBI19_04815 [Oscillospiraceae bacterium]|nr:hypothetical protein [Oscillospiraceae bacterium]